MTNPLRDELATMLAPWLPREMVNIGRHSVIADAALAFIDQHYIPRASLASEEMVERVVAAMQRYTVDTRRINAPGGKLRWVWNVREGVCIIGGDYESRDGCDIAATALSARAVLAAIGEKP